jgi:hypothetical protein
MNTLPERLAITGLIQEALQGSARLAPACELLGFSERTFQRWELADPTTYQQSHRLCEPHEWSGEMLEYLIRFLLRLPQSDLDQWYMAGAFIIEGKSARVEMDIRVVNLLVFVEMIDDTDTMDMNSIATTLEMSRSDAKLIKEVRNRLVHGRLALNPACRERNVHLKKHDPNYSPVWFDVSGAPTYRRDIRPSAVRATKSI